MILWKDGLSLLWVYYFISMLRINYIFTEIKCFYMEKGQQKKSQILDLATVLSYFYNLLLILLYSNNFLFLFWGIWVNLVDTFFDLEKISTINETNNVKILFLKKWVNSKLPKIVFGDRFFVPNSSMAILI